MKIILEIIIDAKCIRNSRIDGEFMSSLPESIRYKFERIIKIFSEMGVKSITHREGIDKEMFWFDGKIKFIDYFGDSIKKESAEVLEEYKKYQLTIPREEKKMSKFSFVIRKIIVFLSNM